MLVDSVDHSLNAVCEALGGQLGRVLLNALSQVGRVGSLDVTLRDDALLQAQLQVFAGNLAWRLADFILVGFVLQALVDAAGVPPDSGVEVVLHTHICSKLLWERYLPPRYYAMSVHLLPKMLYFSNIFSSSS